MRIRLFSILFAPLLFCACGGGSGEATNATVEPVSSDPGNSAEVVAPVEGVDTDPSAAADQ